MVAGIEAHDLATQAKYEEWIKVLEQRGLPIGTIVIDDKWQQHYGTFDVDEKKWPDMKGFTAASTLKAATSCSGSRHFTRKGFLKNCVSSSTENPSRPMSPIPPTKNCCGTAFTASSPTWV
jgi:hypothetical protein